MRRTEARRFDGNDLQELATSLLMRVGVPLASANTLSRVLLWYEMAGRSMLGFGGLHRWLERIQAGEFRLETRGRLSRERAGALRIDGERGLPPLVLRHALEIVVEKARDVGVGCARVENLAAGSLASALVFEAVNRPVSALISGPGPLLVHGYAGLAGKPPSLYDSSLVAAGQGLRSILSDLAPWGALAGSEGWLVMSWSVSEGSPLELNPADLPGDGSVPQMVTRPPGSGWIEPTEWARRQEELHRSGVPLEPAAIRSLQTWCSRLAVLFPGDKGMEGVPNTAGSMDLPKPKGA